MKVVPRILFDILKSAAQFRLNGSFSVILTSFEQLTVLDHIGDILLCTILLFRGNFRRRWLRVIIARIQIRWLLANALQFTTNLIIHIILIFFFLLAIYIILVPIGGLLTRTWHISSIKWIFIWIFTLIIALRSIAVILLTWHRRLYGF